MLFVTAKRLASTVVPHRRRAAASAVATGAAAYGWAIGALPFAPIMVTAPQKAASETLASTAVQPSLLLLFRRALWLLWCFIPSLVWGALALQWPAAESKLHKALQAAVIQSKSAALIKWAQWAAVRPDLFPAALCLLLSELHASAPVHPLESSEQDLADLGLPLAKIGEEPLASGSIAQVHSAELEGRQVAVKLRHPGVEQALLADFKLLSHAAGLANLVPALYWLNAPAMVKQFEMAMEGQCNLREEALSLEAFRRNFRRKPWMVFPAVEAATEAVLVESYEEGEHVSTFIRRRQKNPSAGSEADAHFLLTQGQDCYMQMLLVDNLMHADLHPGNILIRGFSPEHSFPGPRKMVLVDAGMSKELTDSERRNFIGLFQALGDGNGKAAAHHLLHFSDKQQCPNPAAFEAAICELCSKQCPGYRRGVDLGAVLRGMLETVRKHHVSIDGNYATLVVNVMCIESMARGLEPRYNVLDAAYPLLRAHQIMGDTAFRRVFTGVQHTMPPFVFSTVHKMMLYQGLNGTPIKAE